MGIGAVGGYSAMTGIGYQPYVYRNNEISAASLNRIQPISNDVEKGHFDYSKLVEENSLKPGESKDYNALVEAQMSLGMQNAARLGVL